jgi:nitrite reductase/ring-hydroxylating ferredoxin subunit
MDTNDKILEFELCNQNDLENNCMKEIEIQLENKKVKVLLVKYENTFYCIGSRCTHYGVPLVNGVLFKGRIRCFAHGACFDTKTGDIEDFPGKILNKYISN